MHLQSGGKVTKEIADKAKDFARGRLRSGRSPFYEEGKDKRADKMAVGIAPTDLTPYDKYMKERFPTYGTPEFEDKFGGDDTKGLENAYSPIDMLTGGFAGSLASGGGRFLAEAGMDLGAELAINTFKNNDYGRLLATFIGPKGAARLGRNILSTSPKDLYGQFTPLWDRITRLEIPDHNMDLNDMVKKVLKEDGRWSGKASDAYSHPELFKAYPEIAEGNISLRVGEDLERGGTFTPYTGRITSRGPNTEELLDNMTHEGGHFVQDVEGHVQGGRPSEEYTSGEISEETWNKYPEIKQEVTDAANDFYSKRDAYKANPDDPSAKSQFYVSKFNLGKALQDSKGKIYNELYKNYRSIAGEYETNESMFRRKLTPQQRAERSIFSEEHDVGPESIWDLRYPDHSLIFPDRTKLEPAGYSKSWRRPK
jgi:hypothetical protein